MALGDPVDEFQAFEPWSWLPKEWETAPPGTGAPALPPIVEEMQAIEAAPPVPPPAPIDTAPMQPGLGLPQQTVDNAVQTAPQVDAVSGGELPPLTAPEPEQPAEIGELPPLPQSETFDALNPTAWNKPIGTDDLYGWSKRDPTGYAQFYAAHEEARAQEGRDLQRAADDENTRRIEQERQDKVDVLAEAERRHKLMLDAKIDPGRHQRNMSVPQSIAAFLSVVVGGLYQARKGGSNIGLDMLDKAIDRDIAAQQADITNERNAIADFEKTGLSRVEAAEAYRIASYKQAIAGIQTKMQDFDKAGTTALNLNQHRLEIEGKMAAAAEAARRASIKAQLDEREMRRKELETAAKVRGDLAKAQLDERKLMGGTGSAKRPRAYFAALGLPIPPFDMTDKEYDTWQKRQKSSKDLAGGGAEDRKKEADAAKAEIDLRQAQGAETPEQQRVRELGVGSPSGAPLVNKDSKPYIARNPAVAEKLTKQANAAREVADIIDEVLAIRERSGGESKLWNSDDRQRLDVLQNRLTILEKSGTEGMSSDEDMKKLSAAIGAADVSSFRAKAAGLEKGRERTVGFLNQTLRSNQYTGEPVTVPNRFNLPKPKPTEREQDLQLIIKSDRPAPEPPDQSDPTSFVDSGKHLMDFARSGGPGPTDPLSEESPEQIDAAFMRLVGRARHGDAAAWADLETIRDKAVDPSYRQRAEFVLVERPK